MTATCRVAIVGARWPDITVESNVLAALDVEISEGRGATGDELVELAAEADVILAGPHPVFDADVLAQLSCKGIVRYGVGVDNVDLRAAKRLGMWVVNVPDYGTEAVALHTVTMALSGLRQLPEADRSIRSGTWGFDRLRPLHLPSKLTAGVVGYGRIGEQVAHHFVSLGFGRVLVFDRSVRAAPPLLQSTLPDLVGSADVVSLHVPANADGKALFDAELIGAMREGSILINTARGSLIDAAALAAGLAAGRPAIAALDVFEEQPPSLLVFEAAGVLDRLIFSPHMAWYTEESERDLRFKAAIEALRILEGLQPLHPVAGPG